MDQLVHNGVYVLVNAGSGKVLDVPGGGWDNGVCVQQWPRLGPLGSPGQQWAVEFDPDHGTYTIRRPDAEKFLDVDGGGLKNGASIQLWEFTRSDAQRWVFARHGLTARFTVANAGSGRLLGVAGNSTDDGAAIVQWEDTGADSQRWELVFIR
jgi:hypothetical protein